MPMPPARRIPSLALLLIAPVFVVLLVVEPGGGPSPARAGELDELAAVPRVAPAKASARSAPAAPPTAAAPDGSGPASAPAPAEPAPSLRLITGDIEFGRVAHGTSVGSTIRFRNDGDAPLTVLAVRTSCSCTSAEPPERRVIAAGDEAVVQVSFEGRTVGRQERLVRILTDDPRSPVTTVAVRADVG